jgi:hypothetical protein
MRDDLLNSHHGDARVGLRVRQLMRENNDTAQIARDVGVSEARIWNSLARAERRQPGVLKRAEP